nr:hypothetical protein [Tanacetum cinerariifolium]
QVDLYNHGPNDQSSYSWCTSVHKAHRDDNYTWDIEVAIVDVGCFLKYHQISSCAQLDVQHEWASSYPSFQ